MNARSWVAALSLAIAGPMMEAHAQGGILLQGLLDVEGWKTDTMSTLLTRNRGDVSALYRLRLWSAVEPWRGLFLFAAGELEGGSAYDEGDYSGEIEQGGVRLARHRAFVVDAGRMIHPLGAFGARIMSTRNPLIGIPDGYSPVYPLGVMVSGERGILDYRAAMVSLPLTHDGYVPEPGESPRPVIGFGVTPITGFRIGASATDGSYLDKDLDATQLNGRRWTSYRQRILAAELRYGVGHFDLRAEFAASTFEVPTSGRIDGHTGYAEARATVTPRLFVAMRGELNDYPFIAPVSPTQWVARRTEFRDLESGLGFWITAHTLAKASYRFDRWTVTPENASFVRPGGHALAVQLSQGFDVVDWVRRVMGPTG